MTTVLEAIDLAKTYVGGDGGEIHILEGVDLDETVVLLTPAEVAEFARRHAIPYPLLLDQDGKAAADWHVPGYPRSYPLDREGRVRRVFDGAISRSTLEEAVGPHLLASGSCPGP